LGSSDVWGRAGVSPLQPVAWGSAGHPPAATRRRVQRARVSRLPAHKLPRGDARRSLRAAYMPKLAVLFVALLVVAGVGGGCGESSGVAKGATMAVYVAGALCAEARGELQDHGAEAGDVRVRAICLPSSERDGKLDLATIGANARRATEDSSSVAYIGEPTRAASKFAETILEEAQISQYAATSGAKAMREVLRHLESS